MSFLHPAGPVIDLGVNIDHVATLRNARGTSYPDPIRAALLAEQEIDGVLVGGASLDPVAWAGICAIKASTVNGERERLRADG